MSPAADDRLRIGDWWVDPTAGQISRGDEVARLEARTMRLLLDLANHAGEVVSIDDLLERVWAGVIVTPDSVYQAVAALRRLLGDDPKRPLYIATVPRLGYRMVAKVAPWVGETESILATPRRAPASWEWGAAAAVVLGIVVAAGIVTHNGARAPASARPVSVGVLPFLDLTPTMDQEPLADDVTEGLIDKISQNPQLRTPGFRSSFQLKGKHASIAQAAKTLGVAYVVEGSMRKQGARVRIAARLLRADTGFVEWTQTYDQPITAIPNVQASIAGGVAKTLAR